MVTQASHIPLSGFSGSPVSANDCWGFTDAMGREYAIIGLSNGTAVVNISNPAAPVIVGKIAAPSTGVRDMRVLIVNSNPGAFRAYAYVVAEVDQGMQIIDLSNVPSSISLVNTYRGGGFSTAHNVFIDSSSSPAYAYLAGSNLGNGGIRILSLADPVHPVEVGDWEAHYVHDVLAGNQWADPNYDGKTVAMAFSPFNGVDLIDVSNKASPILIREFTYPGRSYTHSGSVSKNHDYLFFNDERDELDGVVPGTTIFTADISNLPTAAVVSSWTLNSPATDHQSLVKGDLLYTSSYSAGMFITDITNPLNPIQVGTYDTFGSNDRPGFHGAWGTYPYYNSSSVAVSDIQGGLFVLQFRGGPNLIYKDHQVLDGSGNGDGLIQPGEAPEIPIILQNLGTENATSVSATLASTTSGITILQNATSFPAVPRSGGVSVSQSPHFQVSFDPALSCPAVVPFSLKITAAGGAAWNRNVNLPIGIVPFFDDLESDTSGWRSITDRGKNKWTLTRKSCHSPRECWREKTSGKSKDTSLLMPSISSLPAGSELRFWHKFSTESGADGLQVEISANGLAGPWTDLGPMMVRNGYNSTIISPTSPISGMQAWSGNSNWMESSASLNSFAGSSVLIRFRLTSDSDGVAGGSWTIDDAGIFVVVSGCGH